MDGAVAFRFDRPGFVDRLADHVHDAAERARTDRHHDRVAGVADFLAADQAFCRIHGDGTHRGFAEMLRDLEHQAVAAVLRLERVQNGRQMAFELHVDDGADDLGDASGLVGGGSHENVLLRILSQTTVSWTGILPLVAFEYGQTVWASSTSCWSLSLSAPGIETLSSTARPKPPSFWSSVTSQVTRASWPLRPYFFEISMIAWP